MNFFSVITSINPPNECTRSITNSSIKKLVVVADKKSPKEYFQNDCYYYDLNSQQSSQFELKNNIPFNHYSRKNLGYLLAIKKGAELIYDTDDDNYLSKSNLNINDLLVTDNLIRKNNEFSYCNIYSFFTEEFIWPRGLPLDEIKIKKFFECEKLKSKCDIVQFLANGDTDVDAIYRLVLNKDIKFKENLSFCLDNSVFSPTNSQSTLFTKKVFPLLYLPLTVSFRFTDILRGIVLKNILDNHDLKLGFKSPIAYQDRNAHNYMKDFESEVSMYLNIKKANSHLSKIKKGKSICEDLIASYQILSEIKVVKELEVDSCKNWVKDLKKLGF